MINRKHTFCQIICGRQANVQNLSPQLAKASLQIETKKGNIVGTWDRKEILPTFWKPMAHGASSKSTQLISRGSNFAMWCPRTYKQENSVQNMCVRGQTLYLPALLKSIQCISLILLLPQKKQKILCLSLLCQIMSSHWMGLQPSC